MNFEAARRLIVQATPQAFPAAVVEVGQPDRVLWEEAFGRLEPEASAPPTTLHTLFDLASLTKVIVTTTLAMRAVDGHQLRVDDRVGQWLPEWQGDDRHAVTVEDLLAHAAGLTPHLPFFRDHQGRVDYERAICRLPLEYPPRTRSLYSDLGFILLAFILADAVGEPIDRQFDRLREQQAWGELTFRPGPSLRQRAAPTERDPWRGRLLVGEVHDENAWALRGVAGHAGLFGTARAVGRFARSILQRERAEPPLVSRVTLEGFLTRTTIPGSSRALGWDTMLPTSSCGTRMSARAIGHTGFTGTSLWIDRERSLYVTLLTNRVYPDRSNDRILEVRPAFHDAVVNAVDRGAQR